MESPEPSRSGYPEEQPAEVTPESDRERGTGDEADRSRDDDDGRATGNPADD